MMSKRVLVAIHPRDVALLETALGPDFPKTVCHTLKDAEAQLSAEVGLIACGVHFNEGAMFELLKAAKAKVETRNTPFYLLVGERSHLSDSMLSSIEAATRLLGANRFIELLKLKQQVGEAEAYTRLRRVVRDALAGKP